MGFCCINVLYLAQSLLDWLFTMSAESPPKYIYKIIPSPPEDPFPKEHPLSDLDRNDGFVHLSTSSQVTSSSSWGNIRRLTSVRYPRLPTYSSQRQHHYGLLSWNMSSLLILWNGRVVSLTCTATSVRIMSILLRSLLANKTKHGAKSWQSRSGLSRYVFY